MLNSFKLVYLIFFIVLFIFVGAFANTADDLGIRVEIKNEQGSSTNNASLRIRLFNESSVAYEDLSFSYYFTATEAFKVNLWDTPTLNYTIDTLTNDQYKLNFAFKENEVLYPNSYYPNSVGSCFAYNYVSWETWDHSLDFSYTCSSSFVETDKVPVYINSNTDSTTVDTTTVADSSIVILNMDTIPLDSVNCMLKIYSFVPKKYNSDSLLTNDSAWIMLKNMSSQAINLENWEIYSKNKKIYDLNLAVSLGAMDTLRLTGFSDSLEFDLSGELWLVKKIDSTKRLSSYVAWGGCSQYSEIPTMLNLWDGKYSYIPIKNPSYLTPGDILKLKDVDNALGKSISDWYKYQSYEEVIALEGLPSIPRAVFPYDGDGYGIFPGEDSLNMNFQWERRLDVSEYLLTIVKDSISGDTIFNEWVNSVEKEIVLKESGEYIWWVRPNIAPLSITGGYVPGGQSAYTYNSNCVANVASNNPYCGYYYDFYMKNKDTIPPSSSGVATLFLAKIDTVHALKLLGIPSLPSRKDTRLLDLNYHDSEGDYDFEELWDRPHYLTGYYGNIDPTQLYNQISTDNASCWAVIARELNHYFIDKYNLGNGNKISLDEILLVTEEPDSTFKQINHNWITYYDNIQNIMNTLWIGAKSTFILNSKTPEESFTHQVASIGKTTAQALNYALGWSLDENFSTAGSIGIQNGSPNPEEIVKAVDAGQSIVVIKGNFEELSIGGFELIDNGNHVMLIDGYGFADGYFYIHLLNTDNNGSDVWQMLLELTPVAQANLDSIMDSINNDRFRDYENLGEIFRDSTNGVKCNYIKPGYFLDFAILPSTATPKKSNSSIYIDSDSDGIMDFDELYRFKTNHKLIDTDGDGLSDKEEIENYTKRNISPDSDGDGIRNELDPFYGEMDIFDMANLLGKDYALFAFDDISINDRAKILNGNVVYEPGVQRGFAKVGAGFGTNGPYSTAMTLKRSAQVGSVFSGGGIWMAEDSKIYGDYGHILPMSYQNIETIVIDGSAMFTSIDADKTYENYLYKHQEFQNYLTNFKLPSDKTLIDVHFKLGSLKFTAGEYYYKSLIIDKGLKVEFDTSNGPIKIYAEYFDCRATIKNARQNANNVLIVVNGTSNIFLSTSIGYTLIAPNSIVTIAQEDKFHWGSVIAANIELHQDSYFYYIPYIGYMSSTPVYSWLAK